MNNDSPKYTTGYVRPEVTFQDTLQNKDEMLKRLENYERVDDIEEVPLGTHIRYVTLDRNKKQVFRLGGILRRIHPKYLSLSNGNHTWSVQRYHYSDDNSDDEPIFETVYWRTVSKEDILEKMVMNQDEKILELQNALQKKQEELNKLKAFIKSHLK